MDPVISYNFAEIDASVSHDIAATSARLHAALDDPEPTDRTAPAAVDPQAAAACRAEQERWQQAAAALHDILVGLGNAVREGAADVADSDRRAARAWG